MAALYMQRGERLRFTKESFSGLGIRVSGPVLRGQMSVREGQQLAQLQVELGRGKESLPFLVRPVSR